MSTVLYYFTLVLHCVIACASITINLLLLFCIFNRTPPTFRSYSVLLKFQAITDMLTALSAISTIQRIIPCNWTLVYISYGPCIFVSSDLCYTLYAILLATNVVSFAIILCAMGARYWILRFGFITKLRIITTICSGALLPALVFVILFVISRGDDKTMAKLLFLYHSDYFTTSVITGNMDIRAPSMLVSAGIIICCPLPVCIVIWIYRSLILRGLYEKTKSMSIQTRSLHKQFVSALTFQAVLPIFPLLGISVSLLGIFGVASNPVLEVAPILLSEIPAFLSPLIVIMHIRYYSDAVRLLFKHGRMRTDTVQHIFSVIAMDSYAEYFQRTFYALSIMTNIMLLVVITFKSSKEMGLYKWMISAFAMNHSNSFLLLCFHFIYRHIAVAKNQSLRLFRKWWFQLFLVFCFVLESTIWFCLLYFQYETEQETYEELLPQIVDEFPKLTMDGIATAHYWRSDNSLRWRPFLGTAAFCSLMTFVLCIVVYCALSIYRHLHGKINSKKGASMQRQLFYTLLVQFSVPFLLMYTPVLLVITPPLFHIFIYLPFHLMPSLFVVFPFLDALVILIGVRDYRLAILRVFFFSKRSSVQAISPTSSRKHLPFNAPQPM